MVATNLYFQDGIYHDAFLYRLGGVPTKTGFHTVWNKCDMKFQKNLYLLTNQNTEISLKHPFPETFQFNRNKLSQCPCQKITGSQIKCWIYLSRHVQLSKIIFWKVQICIMATKNQRQYQFHLELMTDEKVDKQSKRQTFQG